MLAKIIIIFTGYSYLTPTSALAELRTTLNQKQSFCNVLYQKLLAVLRIRSMYKVSPQLHPELSIVFATIYIRYVQNVLYLFITVSQYIICIVLLFH